MSEAPQQTVAAEEPQEVAVAEVEVSGMQVGKDNKVLRGSCTLVNRFKILHKMLDIRTRFYFDFSWSKSCDFIPEMAGLRYAQAVSFAAQWIIRCSWVAMMLKLPSKHVQVLHALTFFRDDPYLGIFAISQRRRRPTSFPRAWSRPLQAKQVWSYCWWQCVRWILGNFTCQRKSRVARCQDWLDAHGQWTLKETFLCQGKTPPNNLDVDKAELLYNSGSFVHNLCYAQAGSSCDQDLINPFLPDGTLQLQRKTEFRSGFSLEATAASHCHCLSIWPCSMEISMEFELTTEPHFTCLTHYIDNYVVVLDNQTWGWKHRLT